MAQTTIRQGSVGRLGGLRAGVASVGPAAVRIVLAADPTTARPGWEATHTLREGEVLPAGGVSWRVAALRPSEHGQRGEVVLSEAGPAPPQTVLAEGGTLRLGGHEPSAALDVALAQASPPAVDLVWWSAQHGATASLPDRRGGARLRVGENARIGAARVMLEGVPPAADHPRWVLLGLAYAPN